MRTRVSEVSAPITERVGDTNHHPRRRHGSCNPREAECTVRADNVRAGGIGIRGSRRAGTLRVRSEQPAQFHRSGWAARRWENGKRSFALDADEDGQADKRLSSRWMRDKARFSFF